MKIAFTSCSDPLDSPQQDVWDRIAEQKPDHLLLLGDQIYMDYGKVPFSGVTTKNFPLGDPLDDAKVPPDRFALEMHRRYAAQHAIIRASKLADLKNLQFHGVWDDHDFGADNSCGIGAKAMSAAKQRISRRMFRDYFSHLGRVDYPHNPYPDGNPDLAEDLTRPVFHSSMLGTGATDDIGSVRLAADVWLHLLDCRSFRAFDYTAIIGPGQMAALTNRVRPGAIHLVASGSRLKTSLFSVSSHPEGWDKYANEYRQFQKIMNRGEVKALMLSGDIHNTDFRIKRDVMEATASGAARKWGNFRKNVPSEGNFATIDIPDGQQPVEIRFFEGGKNVFDPILIDRDAWTPNRKKLTTNRKEYDDPNLPQ